MSAAEEEKPLTWREVLIKDISELKTEVRLGNQKIDTLDTRINGRLKRLEKTVFGDEELKVIGLAEQSRVEAREVKALNKKWAVGIAICVFAAQHVANWIDAKLSIKEAATEVAKAINQK